MGLFHEKLIKAKKEIERGNRDEAKRILKDHLNAGSSIKSTLTELETDIFNYKKALDDAYNNKDKDNHFILENIDTAIKHLEDIKKSIKKLVKEEKIRLE